MISTVCNKVKEEEVEYVNGKYLNNRGFEK
jgi:hypothetical protein